LRQKKVKPRAARRPLPGFVILLHMQTDPVLEWQRLTAHYRELSNEELYELAFEFADLTETAQQALRGEMQSRGLGDPEGAGSTPEPQPARKEPLQAPVALKNAPWAGDPNDIAFGTFGDLAPELVPDEAESEEEDSGPHDYTWKTLLCECETGEEARQLMEALRQAGIESWTDGSRKYSPIRQNLDSPFPRLYVAADQLDRAREIAAQPIPREIIDELKAEVPEYVPPVCPKCSAADPVLEGVEPVNSWSCEQCGAQWSDPVSKGTEDGAENPQ
jgi:hypothetical protein